MRDYHLRGQFRCLYCESSNHIFKFPHEILDHYRTSHSSNVQDCRVHCPACQNILDLSEDPNTLASHYRECVWAKKRQRFKVTIQKRRETRKNDEFVCSECGKRYKSGQQLQFHMKTHTGEGMLFCPHCSYKTPNPSSLKLHVAKHLRDQGILPKEMCDLCGVEVRDKSSLKSHMNTHETQRWNCTFCDRPFKSQRYLDCHVARFHDKSETFKCDVCAKGFSTTFLLKDHKRRNHQERTFKCAHCGKMMYSKNNLIAHERIHTGENPYSCQLCDYTCKSSSTLSLHRKFIHNHGKNLTDHPLQIPDKNELLN
ncbi:hypothetical protein TCAL_14780 [Tigriopus californicus]|uniref:C2H2-type domain-containing protein n=1 Tax=Tigriopus californicus TaxID=6832 RepID=A0A553PQ50_TIGCA|nr:gastrula zinc finger protein XlCGF62.1-like isoform X1 [Tigriopus californicus]XP_059085805.1 gastrula zinc finger protein XlCGF62.1-like isoform X1 [Tigriopus californicus]TRY79818.1 hypothetical protein TCAL_14780 [Tigriopus californicus]